MSILVSEDRFSTKALDLLLTGGPGRLTAGQRSVSRQSSPQAVASTAFLWDCSLVTKSHFRRILVCAKNEKAIKKDWEG